MAGEKAGNSSQYVLKYLLSTCLATKSKVFFKASEKKLSVLYHAQKKFITVWQLNFLRILFTLGKLQPRAAKAKQNFSLKTSPACHPVPAAQAPGNGEGNHISSALPALQCSGLLRKKKMMTGR